jgi:hypothetical protein
MSVTFESLFLLDVKRTDKFLIITLSKKLAGSRRPIRKFIFNLHENKLCDSVSNIYRNKRLSKGN